MCPAGGSEQYLAVDEASAFTFQTHSGGGTVGQADCSYNYVMGSCSRALVNCDLEMDGIGKNCHSGDRVTIKFGQKTIKYVVSASNLLNNLRFRFCKGAFKKKSFFVTKDFTIRMTSAGAGSPGGSCSIRCLHPCDRPCGGESLTCEFSLTSKQQRTDRPGRLADGRHRDVNTFNGQLPGPTLVVCQDDIVEVTLVNRIADSTTLHFHGIRQVGVMNKTAMVPEPGYKGYGPWSDGVPFVTQCPVAEGSKFKYKFRAGSNPRAADDLNAPPGTYWYHSHLGQERVSGLQGALVIKEKTAEYPDVIDTPTKQTITVQEWYESPSCRVPVSILVNGKSRMSDQKFDCDSAEVTKYLEGAGGSFPKVPAVADVSTSYEQFTVHPGKKYRFRIVGMIGKNLPVRFSIDDHTFTAIAADSLYIKPIRKLTYLWLSAGERYDIVVDTKRKYQRDAFKMRFVGFTKLTDASTALCSIAWLKYPGQKVDDSYVTPHDCSDTDLTTPDSYPPAQRTLNPPGFSVADWEQRLTFEESKDTSKVGSIYPADMRSKYLTKTSPVNSTQFIEITPSNTFNGILTTYPQIPYLLQSKNVSERCNATNKGDFSCDDTNPCSCPHVLHFPFSPSDWVQLVLINREAITVEKIKNNGNFHCSRLASFSIHHKNDQKLPHPSSRNSKKRFQKFVCLFFN